MLASVHFIGLETFGGGVGAFVRSTMTDFFTGELAWPSVMSIVVFNCKDVESLFFKANDSQNFISFKTQMRRLVLTLVLIYVFFCFFEFLLDPDGAAALSPMTADCSCTYKKRVSND